MGETCDVLINVVSSNDVEISMLKLVHPQTLFRLFSIFSNYFITEITIGFSGIRTQIVGVEGKHADH